VVNCRTIGTKFGSQELQSTLCYPYPANIIKIDETVMKIYYLEIGWFRNQVTKKLNCVHDEVEHYCFYQYLQYWRYL